MPVAWKTYGDFARSQVRHVIDRAVPQRRRPLLLSMEVVSGLHAGSSIRLQGATFAVGPGDTHDVMLIDDALLGPDTRFTCQMSVFGPLVSVLTDRDDVTLKGMPVRAAVMSAPERLPCDIVINGIHLRLHDLSASQPLLQHPLAAKLAPAALVSLGALAFAGQMVLNTPPSGPVHLSQRHAAVLPAEPNTSQPVLELVTTRITAAGLSEHLQVTTNAADAVRIAGTLPAALMPEWQRVRQDIDQATSGKVIMASVTAAPPLANVPQIAAVRLGAATSIVFADGKSAKPGDIIAENWKIEMITADQMQLERDGETVVVSF